MALDKLPHIVLTDPPETSLYITTTTGRGGEPSPSRDRIPHGGYLRNRLNLAWQQAEHEQAVSHSTRSGIYIEFKSDPNSELVLKSLENLPGHIRLLNVLEKKETVTSVNDGNNTQQTITYATVFVPHTQKKFFLDKLEQYLNEDTLKGKPKNANLIDSIADIRKALLVDSFWSDNVDLVPVDAPEWVEVWLSSHATEILNVFEELLVDQQIQARDGYIKFPERTVKVIHANRTQLENLTRLSDHIAEYRELTVSPLD